MALRGTALTAIILALAILALTVAPTWSMFVLILFGMIAAGNERRRNRTLAVDPSARPLPDDALALDVDALARADAAGKMRRKPEPSRSPSGLKHGGFLNFRGTDTRATITVPLHNRLVGAGTSVFKDDEDLRVRELIGLPKREEAIELFWKDILSRDYAFSARCLEELTWFGPRSRIIVTTKRKGLNALDFLSIKDAGTVDEREKKKGFCLPFDIFGNFLLVLLHRLRSAGTRASSWKKLL